jgi:hypothetical protein
MCRTKLKLLQRHTGTVSKDIQAVIRAENVSAATYLLHGFFGSKGRATSPMVRSVLPGTALMRQA